MTSAIIGGNGRVNYSIKEIISTSIMDEVFPIVAFKSERRRNKMKKGVENQELEWKTGKIPYIEPAQLENNIDMEKIKIDIYNLHDKRLELKNLPERKRDLFMVPKKIIELVIQTTGVDLYGYKVSIDKDEIIHTLKKHGDPIVEAKRGQIAVEREDFIRFLDVLLDPHEVTKSVTNTLHTNKPCLQFEKTIDYKTIVTLEIRTVTSTKKKKLSTLAFKTMYKKN